MVVSEKARPTLRRSGSLTVTRRWAVACGFVGASGWSKRSSCMSSSPNRSAPPSSSVSCSEAQAAFSSILVPVSTSVMVLR